jgi:hypothetical protein
LNRKRVVSFVKRAISEKLQQSWKVLIELDGEFQLALHAIRWRALVAQQHRILEMQRGILQTHIDRALIVQARLVAPVLRQSEIAQQLRRFRIAAFNSGEFFVNAFRLIRSSKVQEQICQRERSLLTSTPRLGARGE